MQVKNKLSNIKIGKYLKYTIFATNILAIIVLVLSTFAWKIMPSKATIIAYLGLGFPIILFINILYLILWVVSFRWKYALVQIAAILICWQPIFTCFPIHIRTSAKNIPENSFKIVTYNVRAFNWAKGEKARNNPIIKYLINSDADIICLQEFAVSTGRNQKGIITEKELNAKLKDYPYHEIIKLRASRGDFAYGLACYSKFPITKATKLPLESTYNGSAMYELKIQDKDVILVNNHLESNKITSQDKQLYKEFFRNKDKETLGEVAVNIQTRLGAAYKKREIQARTIREILDKQKADATIVCGDFNDTPISYAYYTVKGDMTDSFASSGLGQGITYHESMFWFRIDFIMHSIGLESYNCTVDKIKYSDHYPVWTYLTFK